MEQCSAGMEEEQRRDGMEMTKYTAGRKHHKYTCGYEIVKEFKIKSHPLTQFAAVSDEERLTRVRTLPLHTEWQWKLGLIQRNHFNKKPSEISLNVRMKT